MWPEQRGYGRKVHHLLLRRADRENIEHRLALGRRSVSPQERLGLIQLCRERLHTLELRRVGCVAREYEHLEAHVRGEEVVQLVWPPVGRADEDLRQHALADNQVACAGLVREIRDGGFGVVDADAAGEAAEGLEYSKRGRLLALALC